MANLTESQTYDAGVYQLETTDPVVGGPDGISNAPLKNLANRTAYLKKHVDDIESGAFALPGYAKLNSPAFTGNPTAPNQAAGDNDTSVANTAFVQTAVAGVLSKSVSGDSNVTLTAVEAGYATLIFTGTLTANINVIVPTAAGRWIVRNATSGAFSVTVKTSAGTGVLIPQGKSLEVYCDGTNVVALLAPQLATARTISLSGDASGSASFDGSANATIAVSIADDSHSHSTGTIVGLGSAAGKDTVTSNRDLTAGRLLAVGSFGLGASLDFRSPTGSLHGNLPPNNFFGVGTIFGLCDGGASAQQGSLYIPGMAAGAYGVLTIHGQYIDASAGSAIQQIFTTAQRTYIRYSISDSQWSIWREMTTNAVGMIGYFAAITAPAGWLKANGATVSRTVYADLFSVIGTTSGSGDGSTTFHLPDLRGEFVRGWDDARGVDASRAIGSWQQDRIQRHTHYLPTGSGVAGSGAPGVMDDYWVRPNEQMNKAVATGVNAITADTGESSYGFDGGRFSEETAPRNVALLACIKY